MSKRFLVVSPHPDDVELGLGGTILKLKKQGHKVFIVDLTNGEPTPYGTEERRMREAQKAAEVLGVDARCNLGLENRYLFDTKEARLKLAEVIRIFKPDILFCPYPEDAHPDHVMASRITEGARFYAKYTKVNLKGQPHYPFYLFYYFCLHLRTLPEISFLVDISEEFQQKMKAIRCYRSQFVDNPKNRFVFDYIKTQNKYLGSLIRVEYAEAIYSKEVIKVKDIADLL
jgi:bacillithiol biosynthesis deacetylase BshB1